MNEKKKVRLEMNVALEVYILKGRDRGRKQCPLETVKIWKKERPEETRRGDEERFDRTRVPLDQINEPCCCCWGWG